MNILKFRVKISSLLLVIILLCGCNANNRELSGEEIFNKLSNSTVEITADDGYQTSTGSGFYIDENGTVVTNYHVIEGCSNVFVTTNDGGTYSVESIIGYDSELDIAILSTSRSNSIPIEIREEPATTGESIYTLGSSLGLTGTFSEGIVSTAQRELDNMTFIQISAPISSGNSGGPLVDAQGKVLGITSAGFDGGQNLNLAIPISIISQISLDKNYSLEDFYYSTAKKVLVVAIEDDFAPYSDIENETCYGVHVDFAKELANRLGWAIEFLPTTGDGLFEAITTDECYLVLGIENTPERDYFFSDPYWDGMCAIINSDTFDEASAIRHTINEMVEDGTVTSIFDYYGLNN